MLQAQIFIDEEDRHQGKPLYEWILRYLMHHEVKGATLFRGYMGFGSQHHLHAPRKIGAVDARPMMITFIDEDERVRATLGHFRSVFKEGFMIAHQVERW